MSTSTVRERVAPSENESTDAGSRGERKRTEYAVGDVLDGRYELRRELGRGAGGMVYEARHRFTNRAVAVKIVAPDASYALVGELRERLVREARALAAASHPGIVDILDGGITEDRTPYIVLEMLKGRTLEGLLTARGRFSKEDSIGVALQICDALAAAHKAGVVHRDLKPGNIFVVNDHGIERLKLVDFGIAQIRDKNERKLTGIGALLGTPEYMAPEQLLAFEDIDARADVYALGITIYECLSGRCPYVGSYQQILLQSASPIPPPALSELCPEVGSALSEVVHRAFAKKREDRYQTVVQLRRAIEAAIPMARSRTALLGPPALPTRATLAVVPVAAPKPAPVAPEQRRRTARAAYSTPVHIVLPNGASLDGRNEDISEGGMLVLSREPCEAGQRVNLRFAMPIDGRVITCAAHVRWVRASRAGDAQSPRAIGLEFIDLPADLRASVARYIELMGDPNQA